MSIKEPQGFGDFALIVVLIFIGGVIISFL